MMRRRKSSHACGCCCTALLSSLALETAVGGSRLIDMMMMHQVNRLVERSVTVRGQVEIQMVQTYYLIV